MKYLSAIISLFFIRIQLHAQPQLATQFPVHPTSFVKNVGQVKDQNGKINESVRFIYADDHFTLLLGATGFSMQLFQYEKKFDSYPEEGFIDSEDEKDFNQMQDETVTIDRIDVELKNANASCSIITDETDQGYLNFFGATLANHFPSFHTITYKEIYPHIDLCFYATNKDEHPDLRYEFILHPGADPKNIVMQHHGMSSIQNDSCDGIRINSSLGKITYNNLHSYTNDSKETVPSAFRLKGDELTFEMNAPRNETVIIDPNIIWGTYFGGPKSESNSFDLALDGNSSVLITGATKSSSDIATVGAYQTVYAGGSGDIYLAKYNSNGQKKWSTYFGGSLNEISYAVTTDLQNNVYVVGNSSSNGLTTSGVYQETQAGNGDNIIAKFDTAGQLMWCSLLGGAGVEQVRAAVCDQNGFLYIAGYTESVNGIASASGYDTSYNEGGDAFLSKFTSTGQRVWSTYLGGDGQDRAHSLAYDNGFVYVSGTSESDTGFASAGAHQAYRFGKEDAFLAKFDTSGTRIWSTYYGGYEEDHSRSVKVDGAHNVYIGGFTESSENIGTPGTFEPNWFEAYSQTDGTPLSDGFVAKFTPAGSRIWGTYYGGEQADQLVSIDLDQNGAIYGAGSTNSFDSVANKFTVMKFHGYSQEGLLVELDSTGKRIWGSYFGGWGEDDLWSVVADNAGFIYFIGKTDSTVEVTPSADQNQNGGGDDAIIYKLYGAVKCYDAFEPNEDSQHSAFIKATTDTLTYGITASISGPFDMDWYSFQITSPNKYFQIQLTDLNRDYNLKLYRATGQLLMQSVNQNNRDEILAGRLFPGYYYLQVSHASELFDSSNCYRLIVVVGTHSFRNTESKEESQEDVPSLEVSPNPCNEIIHLSFYSPNNFSSECELYDVAMNEITSQDFSGASGLNVMEMKLPDVASGIFFLILRTEQGVFRKKIIVQKN